jgi:exopolyphosphatase/guanosine-5'-triphosphate,3'-diphosphate pyrophosphatase
MLFFDLNYYICVIQNHDMKFAAIDIGSNALRLLIQESRVTKRGEHYFRKIGLTRVPLRLGAEVFSKGVISDKNAGKLVKVLSAFRLLMEVNDVKHYRGCATSAMREAENGDAIIKQIKDVANIDIELISGEEEANLIIGNFKSSNIDKSKVYLYIDVGGGSTEVSLIKDSERVKSYSFNLGTVRLLKNKVDKSVWNDAKAKVSEMIGKEKDIISIGTGGNINTIYKESIHSFGTPIQYSEIKKIVKHIDEHSFEERITKLRLKPDRADVIIPAGRIYTTIMKAANSQSMIVPKVGLSDGMITKMHADLVKAVKS